MSRGLRYARCLPGKDIMSWMSAILRQHARRPAGPEQEMHTKEFTLAQELYKGFVLDQANLGPIHWYHTAKKAAVVLSVDDVFPGTSHSAYEAGGDLEKGALGHLLWLLERHPNVKLTL